MADQKERAAICDGIAILVSAGVMDYNGHVSLRLADGGFLINSGASNRRAMTPDQITHLGADGKVVSGGRPPNEMALHKAIYARRPDVGAEYRKIMHNLRVYRKCWDFHSPRKDPTPCAVN